MSTHETGQSVASLRVHETEALAPDERIIVDDEIAMAARVARRIAHSLAQHAEARAPRKRARHETELMALRDQIGEARNEDVAALLAAMMQLAGLARIDAPKVTGAIDAAAPYFGHLRLEEDGRKRDVLIGKRGMIDREAGVVIVDWRDAPVSRLYYRYDEGDEYHEELGDKIREGRMLLRRTVTFVDGELLRVRCPTGTFVRAPGGGAWRALVARSPELGGGVGKAERAPRDGARTPTTSSRSQLGLGDAHLRPDKHLPEIAALIDPAQFDTITQPTSGLVILQGGAGSGKTTVALHRVAWLAFTAGPASGARTPLGGGEGRAPAALAGSTARAAHAPYRPSHMAIVVAQPQLARYVEKLLPALDCQGVRVFSYASWVRGAVEKLLGTQGARRRKGHVLGRRVIEEAPADVSRVKKHPGMLTAIRAQWHARGAALDDELARACATAPALLQAWRRSTGPPLERAVALRERARAPGVDAATGERVRKALDSFRAAADDVVADWEDLVTDRSLLERTRLDEETLDATLRHSKRQIEEPPDHGDIDHEHKAPVDGYFDPDDPLQAFDVHDLPLLLCMWIERHGSLAREGARIQYDHVVIDEAQDLSALELAPLVVATGERRSVTLAGDVVQKLVFDVGYEDWHELEEQLAPFLFGKGALNVEPLRLSYRSTAEVVEFAREILGPLAPKEPPRAVRTGAPVELFSFTDTGEEIAFLAEGLRSLMAREPQASVALLCRYPERARFYARMLSGAEVPRLRLVLGQASTSADAQDDFSFTPGIDVTHVSRVKGLEYDYVILAEVIESMYPDNVAARHLLHIGATRAAHQLWLTSSTQSPSPLLPTRLVRQSTM